MRVVRVTAVVSVTALLIAAPAASAWITVGGTPATPSAVTADSCDPGTYAVTATAVPPRYEIPGDGVLTSWRTFATISANVGPERLKVITPVSATTFKVVGASAYVNSYATVDNAVLSFPTRIPVLAGDLVALGVGPTSPTQSRPHCLFNPSLTGQYLTRLGADDPVSPAALLTWGPAPPIPQYRVSVSAVLEPDLDHDGFGDETQDRCVTTAGTVNGCPPAAPATTPTPAPAPAPKTTPVIPRLTALTITPRIFRALPTGPSSLAAVRSSGAKVGFALSTAAGVRFTADRLSTGRRTAGGGCAQVTRRNRAAQLCTRAVKVKGGFTRSAIAGGTRFRFTGRLGGRKLRPGGYRLVATPSIGTVAGAPVSTGFTVTR